MAYKFQLGAAYLEGVTTYEDDLKSTGEISGSSAGEFHTLEVGQANFTVNKLGVLVAAATTVDSLNVSEGNITNVGSIALDSISADDGSSFSMGTNWTNASRTVADLGTVTTVDINGGSIDGTAIGAAAVAAGSFAAIIGTTGVYSGILKTDDTTEASSTTDGSLQTDGGLSVAKSAVIGDDLDLLSDAAVLNFGGDKDVNLTHVADTGLLLNSGMELQFRDSGLNIASTLNAVLDISSDGLINMSGSVRTNGTVYAGGAFTGNSSISGAAGLAGMSLVIDDGATIGVASDTNLLELEADTLNVNGALVVSSVSAAIVDPNGSKPFLVWNDGDNAFDYVSWATFVTGVVGTGLSAASGKISLSAAGTITAIGNQDRDLSEGLNYATASLTAARTFRLPAASSLSNGDVVRVKMAAGVSDTNYAKITCSVGAIDNIDGEIEIRLESTYAAVELYKVAANTFRVL